nr:MAG TPA: hypothetical protein [Caudoviricetes sp.]
MLTVVHTINLDTPFSGLALESCFRMFSFIYTFLQYIF